MKIAKPLQGLIVVVLSVIVGSSVFYFVRQDDEEGFLGLASFETTTIPQLTPEPTEEPAPSDNNAPPSVTEEPATTPEAAPVATDEPAATPDPIVTEEPAESTDATPEPSGDTSALTGYTFSALRLAPDEQVSMAQTGDDTPQVITESYPAPLGADVNLLFQWFAFLGLLVGASFAVRKDFTTHRNIMTFLVLTNWFSVIGRMTRNVQGYLEANAPTYSQEAIYLHASLGITVCLVASYLVLRMWFENQLPEFVKVKNIKIWMRLTITGWLLLIAIGTYMYFDIYAS